MQTQVLEDSNDYLVHVRVRIPMQAVERALNGAGVDVGNVIYTAIRDALAVEAVEIAPPSRPVVTPAGIVTETRRKICLDDD